MSEPELPPLDPELAALIDHERAHPGIPDAARVRLRTRLDAAVPAAAPAIRPRGWLRALPVAAVSLALGGAVGAFAHSRLTAPAAPTHSHPLAYPEPMTVTVPLPIFIPLVIAPPPSPVAPLSPPVHPRPVPSPSPSPSPRPSPITPAPGLDSNLAGERALLDIARTALARHDLPSAFDSITRHAEVFPDGQLAEERDALWIQALVTARKPESARTHAALFRAHYPHSLLQPVVDAALRALPTP